MNKGSILLIIGICLGISTHPANAAFLTRTWNNNTNNWTLGGQWTPSGAPNNNVTNTFHAVVNGGSPLLNLDITLDQLTFSGGIIAGTKNLSVLKSTLWTGGELTGSGTTTLGGTATLHGDTKYLTGNRQVVSNGTTTLSDNDLYIYAPGDASLAPSWTNHGTFNATGEADIVLYDLGGSQPRFVNPIGGIFNKTGAGTETYVSVEFDNAGTVNVNSGYLSLYGGTDSGSYTLGTQSELSFYGDRTLTSTSSISGTGKVGVYGGTVTVNGALNLGGSPELAVLGGVLDVNGTFVVPNTISVGGGVANFNTSPFSVAGLVTMSSGAFGGSANTMFNSNFDWTGGELTGSGTTTLGGTATLHGDTKYLTGNRQVVSNGTTTLSDNDLYIYAPGDASLAPSWTNHGTFNATGEADIVLYDLGGSQPRFVNPIGGIFNKTGAGTETYVSVEFDNAGTVNVNSGRLSLSNYSQSSGTLRLNGGAITADIALDIQGGRLVGTGTITGDVANNGTIAPGHSAGSLTITGDLALGSSSAFEIEIGGVTAGSQYDFVSEAGLTPLVLDGILSLNLVNGFQPTMAQTFQVLRSNAALTGAFDNIANGSRLITDDSTGWFRVRYGVGTPNPSRVVLSSFVLSGDFNEDGHVNAIDLASWKSGYGTLSGATHLNGDANGDGLVTGSDFLIWQRQFGQGTLAIGAFSNVPEPSGCLLAVTACALLTVRRSRSVMDRNIDIAGVNRATSFSQ